MITAYVVGLLNRCPAAQTYVLTAVKLFKKGLDQTASGPAPVLLLHETAHQLKQHWALSLFAPEQYSSSPK